MRGKAGMAIGVWSRRGDGEPGVPARQTGETPVFPSIKSAVFAAATVALPALLSLPPPTASS